MIKLSASYKEFKDLVNDIPQNLVEQFPILAEAVETEYYDDFVKCCAKWITENVPSFTNTQYPDCISMTATTYGVSVFKKEMVFSLTTFLDKKTGEITYVVAIVIKKNKSLVVHNPIYKHFTSLGYVEEEIEDRNNKRNNK